LTPPHKVALVVVHSVQAPRSDPTRWQAGRSGSGQLGAPSARHATQVRVAVEQTGVTPPQWLSSRHATQTPTPDETSQRGADAEQCDTSAAVHAAQAPVGKQIGVAAPHSASDPQARHARAVPSQTGFVPPHSPFDRQPTQVPAVVSQTGVAPVQRVAFVAEHWPQAPFAWHAGVAPPQSASAPQARQLCEVASHTGVVPPHCASDRHATQLPELVRQSGVAPVQSALLVAEHWPHAPLVWQAGVAPLHSLSPAQPRQVWKVESHLGSAAGQSPSARQVTQLPVGA
jgi:hypothetical protein